MYHLRELNHPELNRIEKSEMQAAFQIRAFVCNCDEHLPSFKEV